MSAELSTDEKSKKEQIINAWLAQRELDKTDTASILNASYEYVRRIVNALESGKISESDIEKAQDEEFQAKFKSKLDEYQSKESNRAEESSSSTPFSKYKAKKVIINSWLLEDLNDVEDLLISRQNIADAANCSYEYARRIVQQLENGEIDQLEIEEIQDNELQQKLKEWYREYLDDLVETRNNLAHFRRPLSDESGNEYVSATKLRELRSQMRTILKEAEYEAEIEDRAERAQTKISITRFFIHEIDDILEEDTTV